MPSSLLHLCERERQVSLCKFKIAGISKYEANKLDAIDKMLQEHERNKYRLLSNTIPKIAITFPNREITKSSMTATTAIF